MQHNFVSICIKNISNAYNYASYLLHENALLITPPNDYIVPYTLLKDAKMIVCDYLDLDILELLEPFTIIFNIKLNPFMYQFLQIYSVQENIKIVYFTEMECEYFIDECININGKYVFDDCYILNKVD